MVQVLHRLRLLTYLQSEDPVWFFSCACRFTSSTGHGFLCAVARNNENRLHGMSAHLREKCVSAGSNPLPNIIPVLRLLGMKKQRIARYSDKRNLPGWIRRFSQSKLNSFTKLELQEILGIYGRRLEMRAANAKLLAALLQLKQEINDETVNLDEIDENLQSEAALFSETKVGDKKRLLEAFVFAWDTNPLISTMAMKEGSRNEIEVIKALPAFFETQTAMYCKAPEFSGIHFKPTSVQKFCIFAV